LGRQDKTGISALLLRRGPVAGTNDAVSGDEMGEIVAAFARAAVQDDDKGKRPVAALWSKPAIADGPIPVSKCAGFEAIRVFPFEPGLPAGDGGIERCVVRRHHDVGFPGGGTASQCMREKESKKEGAEIHFEKIGPASAPGKRG
jgi:hypothetical protein